MSLSEEPKEQPSVTGSVDPDTETPPPTPLDTPRDGIPPVVESEDHLAEVTEALARGRGPVAVDAERASGHRYGQRAFLVQLRREGSGTVLIDPAALGDLSSVGEILQDTEWVLHAAGQDLPCLAELGLRPTLLFDTELGSRLAGFSRVGLAAVVEQLLGYALAKEHSAVDWSTRPLPEPWLRYAALDVEVLVDLRHALAEELERQGKLAWAQEEFAAVAAAPPPPPRHDPWRRTSGLHRVRSRRQLAIVRELWLSRDALAQEQDVSPGRIVPDASLVEAALTQPTSLRALTSMSTFTGRGSRRFAARWFQAITDAIALPESALPPLHLPAEGPPPARVWAERDPAAAARLAAARQVVTALAEEFTLPVENLLAPDTLRRLCWSPPAVEGDGDVEPAVRAFLEQHGARAWQIGLTAPGLAAAMSARPGNR